MVLQIQGSAILLLKRRITELKRIGTKMYRSPIDIMCKSSSPTFSISPALLTNATDLLQNAGYLHEKLSLEVDRTSYTALIKRYPSGREYKSWKHEAEQIERKILAYRCLRTKALAGRISPHELSVLARKVIERRVKSSSTSGLARKSRMERLGKSPLSRNVFIMEETIMTTTPAIAGCISVDNALANDNNGGELQDETGTMTSSSRRSSSSEKSNRIKKRLTGLLMSTRRKDSLLDTVEAENGNILTPGDMSDSIEMLEINSGRGTPVLLPIEYLLPQSAEKSVQDKKKLLPPPCLVLINNTREPPVYEGEAADQFESKSSSSEMENGLTIVSATTTTADVAVAVAAEPEKKATKEEEEEARAADVELIHTEVELESAKTLEDNDVFYIPREVEEEKYTATVKSMESNSSREGAIRKQQPTTTTTTENNVSQFIMRSMHALYRSMFQ